MSDLLDFDDEDDLLDLEDDLLDFEDEIVLPELVTPINGSLELTHNVNLKLLEKEMAKRAKEFDPFLDPVDEYDEWRTVHDSFKIWLEKFRETGNMVFYKLVLTQAAVLRVEAFRFSVEYSGGKKPVAMEGKVMGATGDQKFVYLVIKLPHGLAHLSNNANYINSHGVWLPMDGSVSPWGPWRVINP